MYKELTGEHGWQKEYYKTLLTRIKNNTTSVLKKEDVGSETINIMMLGYVQSGKSSTINSIFCILDNRISKRAKSGDSEDSFTQTYDSFRGEKQLDDIILYDVMGVEAVKHQGILTEDIRMCMKGEVEESYQFDPRSQKRIDGKVFGKEIHCVMYCVDAESIFQEIIEPVKKKMQEIESELKLNPQDRIVLVTKIDTICDETKKDIRRIFHSKKVQNAVEMAARVFKVSLNQVHPIKNYTDEVEIDEYKNIPLLLGLSKAVDFGTDYLRNMADKAKRKSQQKEQQTEI